VRVPADDTARWLAAPAASIADDTTRDTDGSDTPHAVPLLNRAPTPRCEDAVASERATRTRFTTFTAAIPIVRNDGFHPAGRNGRGGVAKNFSASAQPCNDADRLHLAPMTSLYV
jgi:hypothetical protein